MDLEWVKTFLTAATTENFRETARRRFINQATVSHHIAHLEHELGTLLFERHGRHVALTPAGSHFVPYAERLLSLAHEGSKASLHVAEKMETLTLAASFYAADVLLPWLCQSLLTTYPLLDIEVQLLSPLDTVKTIAEGSADAGLVQDGAHRAGVLYQPLVEDALVFIVAPDGGDLDAIPPSWQSHIASKRLLIQPDNRYWTPILQSLKDQEIPFRTMDVNDISITKKLVAGNVGISIVPELSVTREIIEGRLIGLYPHWLSHLHDTLLWIRSHDRMASPAVLRAEHLLLRRFPGKTL